MKYILKKNIKVDMPIAFLCGPKYVNKKNDRRKILKDYFTKDFKRNALPVIVDYFLNKNKINDSSISIPLLEEICAAASSKTYILLDTFSSVVELGMFLNASSNNKITVILPKSKDKLIENQNFFVSEVYNPENNSNTDLIYYRPRITRVPIASDYVIEYYEFPCDDLPSNIKNNIDTDDAFLPKEKMIEFKESSKISNSNEIIGYNLLRNKLNFYISLKMLFYLVASIKVVFEIEDPNTIAKHLEDVLLSSLNTYNPDSIQIHTNIKYNINEIIKHIIKFIDLFQKYGQTSGEQIITKTTSFIKPIDIIDYFQLCSDDWELINDYVKDYNVYIESFKVKKGQK